MTTLEDLVGDVVEITVSAVDEDLRLSECAETVESFIRIMDDAETAALALLTAIRDLNNKAKREVAALALLTETRDLSSKARRVGG